MTAEILAGVIVGEHSRTIRFNTKLWKKANERAKADGVILGRVLSEAVAAVDDGRIPYPVMSAAVGPRDGRATVVGLSEQAKNAPADLIARLIHAYGLGNLFTVRVVLDDARRKG